MARRKGGCLFTFLGIVIILAIVVAVLVNMTPNTLGFGNAELPYVNSSLQEMGLGDVKLKDVFKALSSLSKNPQEVDEDKQINENTEQADVIYEDEVDYSKIFDEPLKPKSPDPFDLTDKEIGAILNSAINTLAADLNLGAGDLEFKQFTLTKDESGCKAFLVLFVKRDKLLDLAGLDDSSKNMIKQWVIKSEKIKVSLNVSLKDNGATVVEVNGTPTLILNDDPNLANILNGFLTGSFSLTNLANQASQYVCKGLNNLGGNIALGNGKVTVTPK